MILLFVGCASLLLSPEEGTYEVETRNVDADSACESIWGLEVDRDDRKMEVEVDDDSMELDDSLECDRDGASFECSYEEDVDVDDYDAIVTSTIEGEGEWTSDTSWDADLRFEFSCRGADCDDLETDCTIDLTWSGELD